MTAPRQPRKHSRISHSIRPPPQGSSEMIATYTPSASPNSSPVLAMWVRGPKARDASEVSTQASTSGARRAAAPPTCSMWGEKGAELFVPVRATGTIVPTDVFEATRQAIAGNGPEGATATPSPKTPSPSATPPPSPRRSPWYVRWECGRMSRSMSATSPPLSTTCLTWRRAVPEGQDRCAQSNQQF